MPIGPAATALPPSHVIEERLVREWRSAGSKTRAVEADPAARPTSWQEHGLDRDRDRVAVSTEARTRLDGQWLVDPPRVDSALGEAWQVSNALRTDPTGARSATSASVALRQLAGQPGPSWPEPPPRLHEVAPQPRGPEDDPRTRWSHLPPLTPPRRPMALVRTVVTLPDGRELSIAQELDLEALIG